MLKRQKAENPIGAGKKQALRVTFDSRLKLEFHGSKVTSDAGLLAYRKLDEALGLTDLGEDLLSDWRTGKNTQHSMVALMRQSIFSRLAALGKQSNGKSRLITRALTFPRPRRGARPAMRLFIPVLLGLTVSAAAAGKPFQ